MTICNMTLAELERTYSKWGEGQMSGPVRVEEMERVFQCVRDILERKPVGYETSVDPRRLADWLIEAIEAREEPEDYLNYKGQAQLSAWYKDEKARRVRAQQDLRERALAKLTGEERVALGFKE